MSDFANALENLIGQPFFITTEPEILDFTNPKSPAKLVILSKGQRLDITLSHKPADLIKITSQVQFYLSKARLIISWNIKNLFSYVLNITGKELVVPVPIIDLKPLEAFLGIVELCPTLYTQAYSRLETITAHSSWPQLKIIYKSIHTPLILSLLPKIENLGLVNNVEKTRLHPYYELEGQANGRMKCTQAYQRCFNPHTLAEADKEVLTTPDFDDKEFVYFDFKNMEVAVLQWLAKDKILGHILLSGKDVYEAIWETVTGLECSPSRRKICKAFFLPVIFGMGVNTLSKQTGVAEDTAKKIVDRIYKVFAGAMGWIGGKDIDGNKVAVDYYGRCRKFDTEYYRPQLRNFYIQAPASIICLHKLVKLNNAMGHLGRINFHLHDGYCIIAKKGERVIYWPWAKTCLNRKTICTLDCG